LHVPVLAGAEHAHRQFVGSIPRRQMTSR
jgi:hypothetical protein